MCNSFDTHTTAFPCQKVALAALCSGMRRQPESWELWCTLMVWRWLERGCSTDLILGCIADQALCVREGNIGGRHSVALIIGDDLHSVVLPHAHTPALQCLIAEGHTLENVTATTAQFPTPASLASVPNKDRRRETSA